jgi:hypothetical protein
MSKSEREAVVSEIGSGRYSFASKPPEKGPTLVRIALGTV